jgi:hypothetical protein
MAEEAGTGHEEAKEKFPLGLELRPRHAFIQ